MLASRALRVIVALFVIFSVASLLLPRLTGFVSTSAMVNAPLQSVQAPFDGRISTGSPPRAAAITPGELLFALEADRDSDAEVIRLAAERDVVAGRLQAVAEQIEGYRALRGRLAARIEDESRLALDLIAARIRQEQAELRASRARRAAIEADVARSVALSERGALPMREIERLRFDLAAASAGIERQEAVIAALQTELSYLSEVPFGRLVQSQSGEAQRRIDEVDIRLIDLEARHRDIARELAAKDRWLENALAEARRLRRHAPLAAAHGVIWAPSLQVATPVAAGQEVVQVLDCTRRFVEVTVSERHFESIPPGSRAEVRLTGSDAAFSAPVVALRGVAREARGAGASAIERVRGSPGVTLFVALPAADVADPGVAAAFCDVGRTAEVRIVRPVDRQVAGWLRGIRQSFDRLGEIFGAETLAGGLAPAGVPDPGP